MSRTRLGVEQLEGRDLMSATTLAIAETLTHSPENYGNFINAAYHQYLGRSPSGAEVTAWTGAMQHGLSDERVEASFIGSPEYIKDHGGAGAGWVKGMYHDLLGRTPSQSEVDAWVATLARGVSTADVAYGFAASGEREGQRITADYLKYLGRLPSAAEVSGWTNAFLHGVSNEDVVGGFTGSPEYFARQGGNVNGALWLDSAFQDVLHRLPSAAESVAFVGSANRILGTQPNGSLWVADGNNEVYHRTGSGWQDMGQGAVAPDGSFWFLGGPPGSTASPVYRSVNGQMVQQQGSFTDLLGISSDGKVWVANGSSVSSGNGSTWNQQNSTTSQVLAQGVGIGAEVVQFARQYLGQTCPPGSRGECTDLVTAALQHAGAKTTDDFGVSGLDADYVWGTLVFEYQLWQSGNIGGSGGFASTAFPIRQGDIIQYRDVTITNPDGSGSYASHHTAIIEAVLGGGNYRILEQNWDGGNPDGRVVRETTINLANMTSGHYWIYQPVAR